MELFLEVTLKLLQGFGTTCALFILTLIFALPLGLLISFGTMSKFIVDKVYGNYRDVGFVSSDAGSNGFRKGKENLFC